MNELFPQRDAPAALAAELFQGLERPEWGRAIAEAILCYCEPFELERGLPAGFLSAVAARALRGAGEHRAAQRLEAKTGLAIPSRAFDDRALTPALWRVLTSRLIRWYESAAVGGPVCVIHLSALRNEAGVVLELAVCQVLRGLLEVLAPMWDASDGRGGLQLVGWPLDTAILDGAQWARSVLTRLQVQRGWSESPRLLMRRSQKRPARSS